MHGLVMRYGSEAVYDVGLKTLGFPPNWSFPSGKQVWQLTQALEETNHGVGNSR